ncbi:gamma-aminobutyric acid type B receptor subunit 2-like [Anneissia japonica]|uniref:gamma-aminobutyric acid type B receptor subunit 2-like n=1 Tax=Anneissia japonica TaxID=1529436 RepID=UPI00142594D5|nr:gamma-aminobutyric acid type B receptor subunit 2-like [Anneissia japonica]XP_033106897.1 gamma-aminobutyric acid type B receptor subunit 2-like [Anneissia japonica]XP_033106898.1 gamma-aminobutyric acid type B receptor subunit 2-like [Anneissia japonica]XP_033106899.1 gamma-aminobutyric acid type B receptor subunit 2-like [Anneissia japonica]XP_033106900.1 gamma-aminobutyric acid type B receptor subunit 2-like [Anneissia japonica]XP_033106901.1 gamma-aminobutyric acid type B receptor subun
MATIFVFMNSLMLAVALASSSLKSYAYEEGNNAPSYYPGSSNDTSYFDFSSFLDFSVYDELVNSDEKPVINLAGFYPLKGTESYPMKFLGHQSHFSSLLALQHVNDHPTVLKNYHLNLISCDTENRVGVALMQLFETYSSGPQISAVIGGLRAEITEAMSKVTAIMNLVQISYGSHSPQLSDRTAHPTLYRTIPSSSEFSRPRIKLLQAWNWTKVSTLHSNQDVSSSAMRDFTTQLQVYSENSTNDFEVIAAESFDHNNANDRLALLKRKDARIIIGNFYEYEAVMVFCQAYKQGLTGPNHVWMIYGYYQVDWWNKTYTDLHYGCTTEEMAQAVEGYIGISWDVLSDIDKPTISNYTPEWYRQKMLRKFGEDLAETVVPAPYAYDAVWATALAFNATEAVLAEKGLSLLNFTYDDEFNITGLIQEKLESVDFLGVSGPIKFTDNGDSLGILKISQLKNGVQREIARYYGYNDSIVWDYTVEEIWENGIPADSDQTIRYTEAMHISKKLFILYAVMSSFGIMTAIGFLLFNIIYRNERLIKMSSPNMNNVIIFGCILCYITTVVYGLDSLHLSDSNLRIMCQVQKWGFAFGFTLSFGAMFSKTWRVYSIFTNKKLQKRVIKDPRLLAMVGVLLLIDLGILLTWQLTDPLEITIKSLKNQTKEGKPLTIVNIEQHLCQSTYQQYFTGALYIYKGLLLIFGAFITWQTRNVNIPALNDSKYIGLSIYNVVIFSSLGVPLSFLLQDDASHTYVIIGGFIIFCTTLTLSLLFFPKVYSIINGYAPEQVGSRAMSNVNGRQGYGRRTEDSNRRVSLLAKDASMAMKIENEKTSEVQI